MKDFILQEDITILNMDTLKQHSVTIHMENNDRNARRNR